MKQTCLHVGNTQKGKNGTVTVFLRTRTGGKRYLQPNGCLGRKPHWFNGLAEAVTAAKSGNYKIVTATLTRL